MKRRDLIRLLAAAAVAEIAPGSIAAAQLEPEPAQASLQNLFGDPVAVRTLGHRYLQHNPADRSQLAELAGIDIPGNQAQLLQNYSAQRRNDFLNGNIVSLDGWILARAECALCAIVALS